MPINQIAIARMKLKNFRLKPNKSELKLESILQTYLPSHKWKRNSGEIIIEGKVPDYFCCDGPKAIIELIGRRDVKGHTDKALEEKRRLYAKWGFKTKFVDWSELKDWDKLTDDIIFWLCKE